MSTHLIPPEDPAQQCARKGLSQLGVVTVQAMKDETKVVPVSVYRNKWSTRFEIKNTKTKNPRLW